MEPNYDGLTSGNSLDSSNYCKILMYKFKFDKLAILKVQNTFTNNILFNVTAFHDFPYDFDNNSVEPTVWALFWWSR